MSAIICECGHDIDSHNIDNDGVAYCLGNYPKICECSKSPDELTINALIAERDALKIANNQLSEKVANYEKECDLLQKQLDVANKTINEIVAYAQFDPDNDEYPVVLARKAKSEIAKLGEKK